MIVERNVELKKQVFADSKMAKTIENMKRRKLRDCLDESWHRSRAQKNLDGPTPTHIPKVWLKLF
jgi:hypothetical protein